VVRCARIALRFDYRFKSRAIKGKLCLELQLTPQPNPKLMADSYADKLKIAVYIPDYLRELRVSTSWL
jgi:hypothetical protein